MPVRSERFGDHQGQRVDRFRISGDSGVEIDLITYGAAVTGWRVPVGGSLWPVVLGFADFAPYAESPAHMGAVVGRVANRISGARFALDGKVYKLPANDGANSLHGGPEGFAHQLWQAEPDSSGSAVKLSLHSPDGAMGYPGAVAVTATWRLAGHSLSLDIEAVPDRLTPLSLVQHLYFNLGRGPDVVDHRFRIDAPAFTPNGPRLTPTGAILPVTGTIWDFRTPRTMRDGGGAPIAYDGNFVLSVDRDQALPVAEVTPPDGDLVLKQWTDRPGLQLYNSPWVNHKAPGPGGRMFGPWSGFCLEDQALPDALGNPHFPSILHSPDHPYRHRCVFEIKPTA
jgi:aldose 1-epimerase